MIYAQFYQPGAVSKGELFEACGDRAVVIYDARVNRNSTIADARKECKKRGYQGFALFSGASFTRSTRITKIEKVPA